MNSEHVRYEVSITGVCDRKGSTIYATAWGETVAECAERAERKAQAMREDGYRPTVSNWSKTVKTYYDAKPSGERSWNPYRVHEALAALNAVVKPSATLGDDRAISEHLDALKREGCTEVSRHLTASGRPEIVQADPSWFS